MPGYLKLYTLDINGSRLIQTVYLAENDSNNMDRIIIVFGATGNTGIKICEELNSLNIKHSAIVRKGSETKVNTALTDLIQGDVLNKDDIEKVLTAQSFTDVIIALGSRDLKGGYIRSNGTKNIVEVLKEHKLVSKVHVISAHGVRESWNGLKWYEKLISKLLLGKTMKDHELQENIVITNPGGYNIIRPVALKDGPSTGNIHSQKDGPLPVGYISREDVAKYLVASLLSDNNGAISICKG